jgi:hypothetical protein
MHIIGEAVPYIVDGFTSEARYVWRKERATALSMADSKPTKGACLLGNEYDYMEAESEAAAEEEGVSRLVSAWLANDPTILSVPCTLACAQDANAPERVRTPVARMQVLPCLLCVPIHR